MDFSLSTVGLDGCFWFMIINPWEKTISLLLHYNIKKHYSFRKLGASVQKGTGRWGRLVHVPTWQVLFASSDLVGSDRDEMKPWFKYDLRETHACLSCCWCRNDEPENNDTSWYLSSSRYCDELWIEIQQRKSPNMEWRESWEHQKRSAVKKVTFF